MPPETSQQETFLILSTSAREIAEDLMPRWGSLGKSLLFGPYRQVKRRFISTLRYSFILDKPKSERDNIIKIFINF
jgi:hypothetical protein